MLKGKKKLTPIISFIILTAVVVILSGLLSLFKIQAEYVTTNKATGELINNVIEVRNLFSLSGLKHIFTSAVSGFVNFEPLSTLIIVLIGIGVLEKSGFLETSFTLLTKNSKKYTVTFVLVLMSLLFSIVGNIGFAIMLPLGALLFKYGRRNPLGGIIATFAGLSFGTGINIFLSATDSSLLTLTLNAAKVIDKSYSVGVFFSLFLMIVAVIVTSIVFTNITEKRIMPHLPRYESSEEEVVINNRKLRGLIIGLGVGLIYLLIIIYNIIPNLPLSGALLDTRADKYIDMLFGINSLFNKGFIFIVTVFFMVIGFAYGLVTKSIKTSKDLTESLAFSLDGIGNVLVLIFFASLFVNVYQESNIGNVVAALGANIIGSIKFNGIALIIISLIVIAIVNIFSPDSMSKWTIISATMVPLFMNASISPEFTQIVFTAGDSITNGLTPLFMYFVIYLAFMEKYNQNEVTTLPECSKLLVPYSVFSLIIWTVLIVGWFMIGVPFGIGSAPGVIYGA